MWSTPDGDRVLTGHEAELVRETVGGMIDELELLADQTSFPPLEFGIPVWDSLTWQQKLATLDQVVLHLLQPTTSTLPLTAIYESAIGAIYQQIKDNIEVELDMMDDDEDDSDFHDLESWRTLVFLAFNEPRYLEEEFLVGESIDEDECDLGGDIYPSGPDDIRKDLWFNAIERLADRVLWDRDYEMEYLFADVDPVEATSMKGYLGVDGEYFRHAAPDVRDDLVAAVIERVKSITHVPRRPIEDCDF